MADRIFRNETLQGLYAGVGAQATALETFRTAGSDEAQEGIAALERRIAAFEFVLIGNLPSGQNSTDYPYNQEGLRREFLDELVGLLMQRSISSDPSLQNVYTDPQALIASAGTGGGAHVVINKNFPSGDPSFGIFATLDVSLTHADVLNDERRDLLSTAGKAIFDVYSNLIDEVFKEGEKLGDNPARETQTVGAIPALVVDGHTYDSIAQVSGVTTITTGTPPQSTQVPTYDSYLLESTAENSHVSKDTNGNAVLTGAASSNSLRILLSPVAATELWPGLYYTAIDGTNLFIEQTSTGITVRDSIVGTHIPATAISPIALNMQGAGHEFPDKRIVASYRATNANGVTYLIGLGTDGKIYATSLATSRRTTVDTTASLSGLEYLLFYNEARIKILRAKLAYNEAVVREIQDDLREANEALSDLETQAGAITATNSDGTLTNQTSSETLSMNIFNASHSTAGNTLFSTSDGNSLHVSREWESNRTNLKNYIDRRSAEAQQATLDYQNTLNRFNNAFEVMAKLQEKLDTLLKAQLRNLS